MSRTLTTIVGLLLAITSMAAPAAGQVSFGAKGGVTRSTLLSGDAWSSGLGFEVGASVSVKVVERVELQPEVLFARKAGTATLGDGSASISSSLSIDWLEMPILLSRPLRAREAGRITPVAFGGWYSAARLRARLTSRIGDDAVTEDAREDVKRWDYGVMVGGGVEVPARGRTWTFEARYAHGVAKGQDANNASWKSRSLVLLAGTKW